MNVGIALLRCGEPQCSGIFAQAHRFHCLHVADNVAPYHKAVNETVAKCFNDGADWVIMLDGDMELDVSAFWAVFKRDSQRSHKAIYYRLYDPYIDQEIGSLKVVTKKWMDAAGWYTDSIVCDRIAEQKSKEAGLPRLASPTVVAKHFEDPTQFQIFKRFFVRGMKVRLGYADPVSNYEKVLKGFALRSYRHGLKRRMHSDPHDLPYLLEEYDDFIGDSLVCGVCVWGDFPYHFHSTFKKDDERAKLGRDLRMQARYINRLAIGVGRNMHRSHRMCYLSPEPIEGVIPECRWVKLDSPLPHGNLNKFGMYHPDYVSQGSKFITFDLDNVIVGDISHMADFKTAFVCRSDFPTLGKDIAGGDMVGFTKDFAEWFNLVYLPTIPKHLISAGKERFVYRYMLSEKSVHYAFWRHIFGDKAVIGWKSHIRDKEPNTKDAIIVSAWGDWALHEIDELVYSETPNWLSIWKNSYMDQHTSAPRKSTMNEDVEIWKICREATGHHDLFLKAEGMGLSVWKDPNGHVLYRRMRGDVVKVIPNAKSPHPNCLAPCTI